MTPSDWLDWYRWVLNALNLQAVQLDWSFPAEHVHEHLQFALLRVDFVDGAIEALERSVGDVYDFADAVVNLVLWLFQAHALLDFFDFVLVDGGRFGTAAHEAGNAWGVAHNVPSVFAHFHL